MTDLVVGVDGGGTKTRVLVADGSGSHLADVTGPGSAMKLGHGDHSAQIIGDLVRKALAQSGVGQVLPQLMVAGVAGAGRAAELRELTAALEDLEVAREVIIQGDGEIALTDAFGDSAGIVLLCGTGSIAYGRGPQRGMARCGGWGPSIGDEGSGAWIGRKALAIVASAADGREPPTALSGAILTAAQLNEPPDLVAWSIAATPRELAELAPVVLNTAAAGDVRANALVSLAVEELVLHVRALAIRLFGDERAGVSVALGGGLLHKGSLLRKRLDQRLHSAVPGAMLRPGEIDAARGAVRAALLMLEASGQDVVRS